MKTEDLERPGPGVGIGVTIEADEVDAAVEKTAAAIAPQLKLPGFRKGKVPSSLVVQKIGFPSVLNDAIRDSLAAWYEEALSLAGVTAVGQPDIAIDVTPEEPGKPLLFHFDVFVRPVAELGTYRGLQVAKEETRVPEEVIDAEIEKLRDSFARLVGVDREAELGDTLLIDYTGTIDGEPFEGGRGADVALELGSGLFVEGFEAQLVGAAAGDEQTVEVTFPEDYPAEHVRGKDASFEVRVSEVRAVERPEITDEFVEEASEAETVEELRQSIADSTVKQEAEHAEQRWRTAVIDAAADAATIEVAPEVAEARADEKLRQLENQLSARGINAAGYFEGQGKTREQMLVDSREEAAKQLRREAVLAAISEAESIEVSEEELIEACAPVAEMEDITPDKTLAKIRKNGREDAIRGDLRLRKAVDLLVEAAAEVPPQRPLPDSGQTFA